MITRGKSQNGQPYFGASTVTEGRLLIKEGATVFYIERLSGSQEFKSYHQHEKIVVMSEAKVLALVKSGDLTYQDGDFYITRNYQQPDDGVVWKKSYANYKAVVGGVIRLQLVYESKDGVSGYRVCVDGHAVDLRNNTLISDLSRAKQFALQQAKKLILKALAEVADVE